MLDAGDMSDRLAAGYLDDSDVFHGLTSATATITGGDGNDAIAGGARERQLIDGGAGDDDIDGFAGNDSLRGGDGNDMLRPNIGTDTMIGGDGIDTAVYGMRIAPIFTLDGQPTTAPRAGRERPDRHRHREPRGGGHDAAQPSRSSATVAANRLTVTAGRGDITGGEGSDILEGGSARRHFHARATARPTPSSATAGPTPSWPTRSTPSRPAARTCRRQATPGGPFDDRPPLIAWAAPGAGAA